MEAHYITKEINGEIVQEAVRTDMFGFNNQGYDNLMVQAFLMYFNRFDTTKDLIKKLKSVSDTIIALQSDKDAFYNDKTLELVRSYRLPYATVDVQRVYGLNSATVIIDAEGNRNKYGKSLKQTSINL